MRKILPLLFILVGGAAVYAYMTGHFTGVSTSGAGAVAGKAGQVVQQKADEFYNQPWFWTLALSAGAAAFAVTLWRRMNGFVRGTVIAVGAIAVVVIVMGMKH